jgi:hypothetical protein
VSVRGPDDICGRYFTIRTTSHDSQRSNSATWTISYSVPPPLTPATPTTTTSRHPFHCSCSASTSRSGPASSIDILPPHTHPAHCPSHSIPCTMAQPMLHCPNIPHIMHSRLSTTAPHRTSHSIHRPPAIPRSSCSTTSASHWTGLSRPEWSISHEIVLYAEENDTVNVLVSRSAIRDRGTLVLLICSSWRRACCHSTSVSSLHPCASFPVSRPRQSPSRVHHRLRLARGASSSSSPCPGIESGTTVCLLDLALATVQVACASIISIARSYPARSGTGENVN